MDAVSLQNYNVDFQSYFAIFLNDIPGQRPKWAGDHAQPILAWGSAHTNGIFLDAGFRYFAGFFFWMLLGGGELGFPLRWVHSYIIYVILSP